MAKPAAAQVVDAAKFNPLMAASALVTIVGTALYLAPAVGLKVPQGVSKIANAAMTFGAMFGVKSLLKPA